MGLKSFFQRKNTDAAAAPAPRSRRSASAGDATEAVQQARVRARQRLIGAVVLLGVGIIGFPLLFETQPRPIPVDLPIEIPRKDSVPALQLPPPRAAQPAAAAKAASTAVAASAATEIVETAADAGREVPAPAAVAAATPASKPQPKPPLPKPSEKPVVIEKPPAAEQHATAKPGKPADDGSRAKALLDGKPPAAAAEAAGRYVVQVGAFSEAGAAREMRLKVEKLGLKTYTQAVETDSGKRIRVRVGPFGSREEADKAAAKIKAAGLNSAVLTL